MSLLRAVILLKWVYLDLTNYGTEGFVIFNRKPEERLPLSDPSIGLLVSQSSVLMLLTLLVLSSTMVLLYCTVLYCTVLYCTVLYSTVQCDLSPTLLSGNLQVSTVGVRSSSSSGVTGGQDGGGGQVLRARAEVTLGQ